MHAYTINKYKYTLYILIQIVYNIGILYVIFIINTTYNIQTLVEII